jgi:hypothetical protein
MATKKKQIRFDSDSENLPSVIGEEDFIKQAKLNEGFKVDESVIPFTRILQPLSPQLRSIEGATAGMMYNFASGTLIDGKTGFKCICVLSEWNYTEWTPRNEGGGFIKNHGADEASWQALCNVDQHYAYQPVTKDGHSILKARHFAILQLKEDGNVESSIFPFAGTALKVARQWTNMLQNAPKLKTSQGMLTPAYFYYQYKVTVVEEKNAKGHWFLPHVDLVSKDGKAVSIMEHVNGKEIWEQAIKFRDNYKSGDIKAESQDTTSEETF